MPSPHTHPCAPRIRRSVSVYPILLLLLLLGSCSTDDPVAPSYAYTASENEIFALVNQHRAAMSPATAALAMHDIITQQARRHSEEMAAGAAPFNHDGFTERVAAISTVLRVSTAGENIAMNQGYSEPAAQAMNGWLNSPPHKANIEGAYTHTGIGIAKSGNGAYYFTQIFVKVN